MQHALRGRGSIDSCCIYTASLSPAFKVSSEILRSDAIEIHDRIMVFFFLPRITNFSTGCYSRDWLTRP